MANTKNKNKIKKAKSKQNKEENKGKRILIGILFCAAAFFVAYSFISADNAGKAGQAVSNLLLQIFGTAAYMVPFILFWFGTIYCVTSTILRNRIDTVLALTSVALGSILCSFIKDSFDIRIAGGWIGNVFANLFDDFFGNFSIAAVFIALIFVLSYFFRISLLGLIKSFIKGIIDDIKQWYEYRKTQKQEKATIINNRSLKEEKKVKQDEEPFGIGEKPRIIDSKQEKEEDKDFVKEQVRQAREKEEERKRREELHSTEEERNDRNENSEASAEAEEAGEIKEISSNRNFEKIDTSGFKYVLPPVSLLRDGGLNDQLNEDELQDRAERLKKTLEDFRIKAVVKDIIPGPVITRYDIILAPGVKIQSVMNISDNISLAMKSAAIRIEPIPEKSAVGIEIPNPKASLVSLKDILDTEEFHNSKSLLALAVGTTTDGKGYISDLAKMPHLLIAGSTGSGKSVGVHNIILSILFKARPDEVKFILVDPKRVEMTAYKDIPHLYNPCCIAEDATVITRANEASAALKKLVTVMEQRYDKYASVMVRNIGEYNAKMAEQGKEKDYFIVVIIDELADLMMVASKEIEDSIQRLAQMARAVGIHLVLATQRPSINVITGTIKANFPARMSFQTTSAIDSKVILDSVGAENLIGKGDMLLLPPSEPRPVRLQGAFVSTKEIEQIVKFISDQDFPKYYEPLVNEVSQNAAATAADKAEKDLIPALRLVLERRRVSQDLLKAQFGGSARATNILSVLEMRGFIHKPEGTNRWEINYNLIEDYLRINA